MQFIKLKKIDPPQDISDFYGDLSKAKKLGEGTYGKVYKVKRKGLKTKCALKVINKNKLVGPIAEAMLQELEILESINHPHIMRVHELLHDDVKYYIATELCSGGELFDYIIKKQKVEEKEACRFFQSQKCLNSHACT